MPTSKNICFFREYLRFEGESKMDKVGGALEDFMLVLT